MAITLVNGTAGNSGTAGITSFTSTVPAGVATDDLLLWTWATSSIATPSTPTGWLIWQPTIVTASSGMTIFYRWANSEPGSYASGTVGTGRWAYAMNAYRGVDRTTPADVATQNLTGNTTYAMPAVTPITPNAWVIGTLGVVVAAGSTGTVTSSNMTMDASTSSSNAGAANSVLGIGHMQVATPAATTPVVTVNQPTVRSIRFTSALRPAPAPFTGWGVPL